MNPVPPREQLLASAVRGLTDAVDELTAAVDAATESDAMTGPRRIAVKARALSALLKLTRASTRAKIIMGEG